MFLHFLVVRQTLRETDILRVQKHFFVFIFYVKLDIVVLLITIMVIQEIPMVDLSEIAQKHHRQCNIGLLGFGLAGQNKGRLMSAIQVSYHYTYSY